ncbi:tRNA threonylcarbamoyladenosine biosynthesis protein TsaB [Syntrophus gentianae]|uniref:tRNA threonylcarbamoyladenosine biosynthesis protein TsaB n=1 Tax=Syntrophus gentianae TaxID=43775 RepID=A0A1H7ZR89_9BACT|nr:tRNA (adenosine(37)-N6)-threonylcarbamoyltransferase complex dimerization subunit type 1 TsaB [Syntrophus gentianae]SEM60930.1 tRNA threonylcarbamoyladenosine biosynthesis protein TsaB [Syntrophus gentianae]
MITLALDTSAKTVGIALLEDENILVESFYNLGVNSSVLLLPAIEDVFGKAGLDVERVDLLACTVGPGSFTGLRIGLGTLKGLALATGKPIVGVSTLEALAFNGIHASGWICPMMDAQKKQIYTAIYTSEPDCSLRRIGEERLVDLDAFLPLISEKALFIGDGAMKYRDRIAEFLTDRSSFAAPHLHAVRASAVGLLARRNFARGEILDLMTFTPRYLRLSEAEVKLLQKNAEEDEQRNPIR